MRKSFDEYDIFIFDLDGTLYYQRQLRFMMAKRLACFYILHPARIKELLIVKKFREVRDAWSETGTDKSIDDAQYEYVAGKTGVNADYVKAIIQKWIYDNPLDAVAKSKDCELAGIIGKLRDKNKKVIIFSDYPVEDKMKALNIAADEMYCSAKEPICELKPSSKGLNVILDNSNAQPEDAIMIGDRMVKDGECAKGAGMDYLILEKSKKSRKRLYEKLITDI